MIKEGHVEARARISVQMVKGRGMVRTAAAVTTVRNRKIKGKARAGAGRRANDEINTLPSRTNSLLKLAPTTLRASTFAASRAIKTRRPATRALGEKRRIDVF